MESCLDLLSSFFPFLGGGSEDDLAGLLDLFFPLCWLVLVVFALGLVLELRRSQLLSASAIEREGDGREEFGMLC